MLKAPRKKRKNKNAEPCDILLTLSQPSQHSIGHRSALGAGVKICGFHDTSPPSKFWTLLSASGDFAKPGSGFSPNNKVRNSCFRN